MKEIEKEKEKEKEDEEDKTKGEAEEIHKNKSWKPVGSGSRAAKVL